ncbi:MAG: CPBP family intramembrane metalloprotease [Acidobacteriaceae bacterium]|nr:CPBP family intramembrane metalloprotease [Acidobacteriaceae bacterium]
MFRTLRPFFITIVCSYVALLIAASLYSQTHAADAYWIWTAALPAFLLEATFYLGATSEAARAAFARVGPPRFQAGLLWLSAFMPYLLFSLLSRTFVDSAFYLLLLLTGIFAFWYAVLPQRPICDFGFLVVAAVPVIARVFQRIYRSPDPHIPVDILGHLMWIRMGIVALLVLRRWNPGKFGLWPRLREWKIGIVYYLLALFPICLLALGLHDVRFAPLHKDPWQMAAITIGTFFGILWVVALSEELFFRGVVTPAVLKAWQSPVLAVVISAVLYGSSHLWFQVFPNWRRALVTTLLGLACGAAYLRSGSVRAPMVTHAFMVTTWRLFFH